jgi:predicted CoA-binding protein
VYVNAEKSAQMFADILAAKPKRIIFNPGAENPELEKKCKAAGIDVEEACTLVLLRTNQFERS